MKKPQILAILLLLALAVADAALLGGWRPIDAEDLKDPDVIDAAKFAVKQHNQKEGEKLKLVRVESGSYQVVRGKNYKLELTVSGAADTNGLSKYEAIVWVQPGAGSPKKLTSFKKVP
ncbi:unnamed protein product [Linum tenue]|uniref:Cystatin domain-containing protein n=2 Tax=Linum TaxID=4005 RepID=A0AAV0M1H2_9ROSI|nr:unnamed protein product [Linum tenue]